MIIRYKRVFDTFSGKIIFVVSLCMSIIIAFVIYVVFLVSTNVTDRIVTDHLSTILKLRNADFEEYMRDLTDYAFFIRNDESFLRVARQNDLPSYADEQRFIIDRFKNMFYGRPDIYELALYIPKFDRMYGLSRGNPNLRVVSQCGAESEEWYKAASGSTAYIHYARGEDFSGGVGAAAGTVGGTGTGANSGIDTGVNSGTGTGANSGTGGLVGRVQNPALSKRYFTFYRALINISDKRTFAVVKITVTKESFDRFFEDDLDKYVCLFGADGNLYYENKPGVMSNETSKKIYASFEGADAADGAGGSGIAYAAGSTGYMSKHIDVNGEDCLAIFHRTEVMGWSTAFLLPFDDINATLHSTRTFSIYIAVFAILVSVTIIMIIIRRQTAPLKNLAMEIAVVGGKFSGTVNDSTVNDSIVNDSIVADGSIIDSGTIDSGTVDGGAVDGGSGGIPESDGNALKMRVYVGGVSEIRALSSGINAMLDRINTLVEQNYVTSINEKTARIAALEAQLNPHFLYNTLQAISTKALLAANRDVSQMIDALAYNLRYLIKADMMVPLKEELANLQNYFLLLKTRFEDRLNVDIRADPLALGVSIPKIAVQLLVENSVRHALEKSLKAIHIEVSVFIRGNKVHIVVSDDGDGMTAERLSAVRETIKAATHMLLPGTPFVGLANLCARLKLLYGDDASFQLDSREGEGTRSVIILPNSSQSGYRGYGGCNV